MRARAGFPTKASCQADPTDLILWPKISSLHVPLPLEEFSERIRNAVLSYNGTIVNTTELSSLEEQVRVVAKARVIVMTFGSAFDYNSLFMRGATVIAYVIVCVCVCVLRLLGMKRDLYLLTHPSLYSSGPMHTDTTFSARSTLKMLLSFLPSFGITECTTPTPRKKYCGYFTEL